MNIPTKYLPKQLSKKDKIKQFNQLKKSINAYKKGKYIKRKTLKSFRSKKSNHVNNALKMYNIKNMTVNNNLSKKTKCSLKALNQIVKKGQGAYYSSGSRPNQTAHSWGLARLASSITGGNAALVDYKILQEGCKNNSLALKLAKVKLKNKKIKK